MARKRSKDEDSGDEIEDDVGDGDAYGDDEDEDGALDDARGGDDDDEDDEEDEEDDDDDDDGGKRRGGKRKRKKRKTGMSIFIDEEAEEDDEADEEDEEDEGAGVHGIIDDGSDGEGGAVRSTGREALRAQKLRREHARMDENRENILTRIEQRYARGDAEDIAAEDEDIDASAPVDASGVDQQSLQPTIRDPRLFVLRCRKPGRERHAVLTLLQKMFDLKARGVDIGIMSAVAPDHLRGFIYVEAYSASQVEHAIRGLDLIANYNGIKPIALEEMTDVLQVGRKLDKQKKGNWVRPTRGMYKGDLAQVYSVPEGGTEGQVMIRLIPRLKFRREGEELSDPEDDEDEDGEYEDDPNAVLGTANSKLKRRPPQKLFDPRHVGRLHSNNDDAVVLPQRDRYSGEVFDGWNGELFRHGLLYKRVSVKTLVINDAVQPTPEELDSWIAAEVRLRLMAKDKSNQIASADLVEGLSLDMAAMAGKRKVTIFKGDTVKVIRGEQKGLSGTVVGFDGPVVLIKSSTWGSEPLRAARVDVVKNFNVGDHVKVSSGKRVGHSGVIVAVDGDGLTVFTDSTREEIRVMSANVADASDLAADDHSVKGINGKQLKLFDLVYPLQDKDAKGIIVGVQGDTLSVLNGFNVVHEYPGNAVRHVPRDAFTHALDSRGNKLSRNIALHVVSGPLKDRAGVIVEVTGNTVFFKGSDEVRNCGILAVASQDCEAQAAAARTMTSTGRMDSSGQFKVPNPVPKGALASLGGGRGREGMNSKPRDMLRGRDVKVTKGPFKGHLGKVVDTTETTVRVELQSKMKVVTLTRDKVKCLDEGNEIRSTNGVGPPGVGNGAGSFGAFSAGAPGSRTPNYTGSAGARTPYGGRTPNFGGARTPLHGSGFGFGSRTPGHTSSFGGGGSRTPAHGETGGSTPRAGGAFGGLGSHTPGHDAFRPATPARADDYGAFGAFGAARAGGSGRNVLPGNNANPYISGYGGGVPNTPGTPAMLPVTPAGGGFGNQALEAMTPADPSYIPQTPMETGYLPQTPQVLYPQTPQVGVYEPQTPYGDVHTPAPMVPQTPRTPEPSTPLPQTPAPTDEGGQGQAYDDDPYPGQGEEPMGYRVLIDVVVSVPNMGGRSAVVLDAAVDGRYVTVRMLDDNVVHQLDGTQFTPVQPRVGVDSLVKVLDGALASRVGQLTGIDPSHGDGEAAHGLIDFGNGDVQSVDMDLMAKYQRSQP